MERDYLMEKETEVQRDLLTQQLVTRASPLPDFKADFTAQVMAQIEVQTLAQRAKIYEPLLPVMVWRWIGISLCSMVLLVLGLSVLAFGPQPDGYFGRFVATNLQDTFANKQLTYLPELLLAGVICFCWLVVDYLYGRLRQN